jgi:hypothetical protein
LSVQQLRPARQAAARRVVPAVWSAWSSERPHSEASSVHRDAAVAPSSCFRHVEGRPSAALSEPAWWQVPAAAWRQPAVAAAQEMVSPSGMKAAAVAESSVRLVAWAPQARPPAEEASDVKVQPLGAAEVLPGPLAQQRAEAEAVPLARQPVAAEVAPDARVQPPEASGAALDAVAEPQRAAAEGLPDVQVQPPGVAGEPAPSARQPVAERPSAPPSSRPEGHPLPWLAPRQSVRSAHAMRRSRTASPSKQSWRAAGCEALS